MKKYTKNILVLLLGIITVSCSDNFLEDNIDPNNPTAVSPNLVLPVAQSYSAGLIHDENSDTNNNQSFRINI